MATFLNPKAPLLLLFLFFMALLLISCEAINGANNDDPTYGGQRHLLQQIDCAGKCAYRCSKASRAKICLHDCNACCHTCKCVPPGTAGNREQCPCYANLKNSKGTGKCP